MPIRILTLTTGFSMACFSILIVRQLKFINLFKRLLMKRMLPILILVTILAVAFTACNSRQDATAEQARFQAYKDSLNYATDTSGLAKYQAWKAQHELADINQYGQSTSTPAVAAAPAKKVIKTYVPVYKTSKSSSSTSSSTNSGSMTSESSNTAETVQKKGWSKAAKGAAIGGGAGAVIGALLNKKNRVLGGVIGGAVGAGVGYGLGRSMDKKDGRY